MKNVWTRRRKRNVFAAGLLDLQDRARIRLFLMFVTAKNESPTWWYQSQVTIILPSLEAYNTSGIGSVVEEAFFTFQEIKLYRFHLKCGRFARCKCLHSRVDTIGLSVCANQYTSLRVCVSYSAQHIYQSLCAFCWMLLYFWEGK